MGLTIGEWEKKLSKYSNSELLELRDAVDKVLSYPEVKKEFGWTCLSVISTMAESIIKYNRGDSKK